MIAWYGISVFIFHRKEIKLVQFEKKHILAILPAHILLQPDKKILHSPI